MGMKIGGAAAAALVAAAALASVAQADAPPGSPAAQVAARQHNFKQLGGAFKAILDELKKATPDRAVLVANAQKMHALAGDEPNWFPKGSGAESGTKTAAKPEIWADPAGFTAAVERLQAETAKLQQVAANGDLNAVRAEVRATGGACKNCHDKYRVPDKD